MEICEQAEMFAPEDRDLAFSHSKFILREGNQYYYAISSHRCLSSKVDIHELNPVPIPSSQLWPSFPTQFRQAPEPLPHDCFVKRPSLLDCGDNEASNSNVGSLLLHEAEVCEILKASPHPNIAQYLGCLVENDKIMGFCFVKYGMNLYERATKDSHPFDADLILRGIREGIRHLHSLGLIHCDINPANIVMDGDTPVIVDFDSCQRNGEKLGIKGGTPDWTREDFEFARPENDEYGLSKIRDFLLGVHKM